MSGQRAVDDMSRSPIPKSARRSTITALALASLLAVLVWVGLESGRPKLAIDCSVVGVDVRKVGFWAEGSPFKTGWRIAFQVAISMSPEELIESGHHLCGEYRYDLSPDSLPLALLDCRNYEQPSGGPAASGSSDGQQAYAFEMHMGLNGLGTTIEGIDLTRENFLWTLESQEGMWLNLVVMSGTRVVAESEWIDISDLRGDLIRQLEQ